MINRGLNQIPGNDYYILVDGLESDFSFQLRGSYNIQYFTFDEFTHCGIGLPPTTYQCIGNYYNVILDYSSLIDASLQSNSHSISDLGNGRFRVNNVYNESVDVEVLYTSDIGFSCSDVQTIPAYGCNVYVENCFGIDPPAAPAIAVSCPGEEIPTATVYNPSYYDVLWFENENDKFPLSYGNSFTPPSYGIYYVQFSDFNLDCESAKIAVEFSQEENLEITPIIIHNECFAATDGEIELLIDRDVTNYQFNWSTGVNGVTSINSLPGGEYTVSITTAYGCESDHTFKISEPDPLRQIYDEGYSSTQNCEVDDLALLGEEKHVMNLQVGDEVELSLFTQNIDNVLGCQGNISWNPNQLRFNSITFPITQLGEISVDDNNALLEGELFILFASLDGLPQTFADSMVLIQLSFIVESDFDYAEIFVFDDLTRSEWYDGDLNVIQFCSRPSVVINGSNSEDFNLCNGETISLMPDISGGAGPYSYRWSTGDTTSMINIEDEGYYEVEVFDANLCSSTFSYYITKSSFEEIAFVHEFYEGQNYLTAVNNNLEDGKWSTNESVRRIEVNDTGWYWYEIEDELGCKSRDSIEILVFEPLEAEAFVENAYCQNNNGKITINATKGVPPLFYALDGDSFTSEYEFADLPSGEYAVKIRDSHGNIDTMAVTVEDELEAIKASLLYDGSIISIELVDQFPPYTVYWNGVQTDNLTYTPTMTGINSVELIDNKGCTYTDSIAVELSTNVNSTLTEGNVLVFPNPFQNEITIEFPKTATYTVDILNTLGQIQMTKETNGNSLKIDLATSQSAVFLIVIRNSADQTIHIEKVIKI